MIAYQDDSDGSLRCFGMTTIIRNILLLLSLYALAIHVLNNSNDNSDQYEVFLILFLEGLGSKIIYFQEVSCLYL